MAMRNPKGRVNYEPNSWGVGPRESKSKGFHSFSEDIEGKKQRSRSEKFADHYSQARQFYLSQTAVEQAHIADALVFELSKVKTLDIRTRMVAHLRNIDETLAKEVASGLRVDPLPEPPKPARAIVENLEPSPALSIVKNGPKSFAGRSVGILVTDGVDAGQLKELIDAISKEGAKAVLVAPKIGGVQSADGRLISADEKIDGGPSVLFDAVVLLVSEKEAASLSDHPAARDFVADALAHHKFVGYSQPADSLLKLAGKSDKHAEQLVQLSDSASFTDFIARCRSVRNWPAEDKKESNASTKEK